MSFIERSQRKPLKKNTYIDNRSVQKYYSPSKRHSFKNTRNRNSMIITDRTTINQENYQSRPFFSKKQKFRSTRSQKNIVLTPSFLRKKQVLNEKTELQLQDFEIGQFLGRGAFATVNIIRHKKTGYFLAMRKIIKKSILEQRLDRFIHALKIQIYCSDPNIAKVYKIINEKSQLYIIMELCIDGDLTSRIKQLNNNQQNKKKIIIGIVKGLSYLHSNNILHRDLKLQNILICYDMPKITDFDLAVYQCDLNESRKSLCGSPMYFCPQMIENNSYNSKLDIWCLGILCYEIVCGYFPFQLKKMDDLSKIVSEDIKGYPENISQSCKNFISQLLVKDPERRAGWKQILVHPYLE